MRKRLQFTFEKNVDKIIDLYQDLASGVKKHI